MSRVTEPPPRSKLVIGTWLGVLSALSYTGTNVALRLMGEHKGFDQAVWISAWKGLPAAVAAWCLIALHLAQGRPALPARKQWLPLITAGFWMQFGGNVMFQWALSIGGLALTVPLTFATILLSSAILGRVVLGEAVTMRSLISMGLLIFSIVCFSLGSEQSTASVLENATTGDVLTGVIAAMISGTAYGSCGVIIRRTVTGNVALSGTLVFFSTTGVLALGLTSWLRLGTAELLSVSGGDVAILLTAGTLNAIAFFAIGAALRHLNVLSANLINSSQAAMCAAVGVLWFQEAVSIWLFLGLSLTVIGLLLLGRRKTATPTMVEREVVDPEADALSQTDKTAVVSLATESVLPQKNNG